jgi:hypothetical protein
MELYAASVVIRINDAIGIEINLYGLLFELF